MTQRRQQEADDLNFSGGPDIKPDFDVSKQI
jgi:hypothetical protein